MESNIHGMTDGKVLTAEQKNFYNEKGYLLTNKHLFSEDKFSILCQIFEELLHSWGNTKGDELDVPQNHYSLHDSRIIHGANANNSNMRRTGYTKRYFNTDLVFQQDHPEYIDHKIYPCRGENRGKNPLIYL